MRPSELRDGDRVITTANSIYNSIPIGTEGVSERTTCGTCTAHLGCFILRADRDGMTYCVYYLGAKVMRRK